MKIQSKRQYLADLAITNCGEILDLQCAKTGKCQPVQDVEMTDQLLGNRENTEHKYSGFSHVSRNQAEHKIVKKSTQINLFFALNSSYF